MVYRCKDELQHYGVKGMRWGVQKSKSASEFRELSKKYKRKRENAKSPLGYQRAKRLGAEYTRKADRAEGVERLKKNNYYGAKNKVVKALAEIGATKVSEIRRKNEEYRRQEIDKVIRPWKNRKQPWDEKPNFENRGGRI